MRSLAHDWHAGICLPVAPLFVSTSLTHGGARSPKVYGSEQTLPSAVVATTTALAKERTHTSREIKKQQERQNNLTPLCLV